jgi:hypothetical protein
MRDLYELTGLNQFDSNPTNDPDLIEMIADTWIEKALYYALRKAGDFPWRESWVVVDGTKYYISINNSAYMGYRSCASLQRELRELQAKIKQTKTDISVLLEAEKQKDGTYTDVGQGIAIALGLINNEIGE